MPRSALCFLLLLIAGVAGQWALDVWGDRARDFWTAAVIHGVATVPYIFLCRAAVDGRFRPSLVQALSVVVLLRLLALPLQPALSDDIYRYMHEGTMVLEGHNPYLTAPADVAPEQRHPEYWSRINHPEVPAAYPPAVQFGLAAGVLIWPTPLGQKIFFGLCDVLLFVVLWFWLPRIGSKSRLAIVHGFCPLMVLEFAGEGHSDTLPVLCMVAALFAIDVGRRYLSSVLLAVATAGKLMPVVLLPYILRIDKGWWAVVPFVVVLAALYAPFAWGVPIADWSELFSGTVRYADAWRGNDSGFHVLHALAERFFEFLQDSGIDTQWKYFPHRVAKLPIVILGGLLLILAWWRNWPVRKVAAAFFMLFVSLTPTMHPWYFAFLIPFLCIYPNTLWFVFTGTIYLAYHVRPDWLAMQDAVASGIGDGSAEVVENLAVKVAEYIPFYLGFFGILLDTRSSAATDRQARES